MHARYNDIISRIPEAPKWYDQNGVPRYDNFSPDYCPNIYSDGVVLLRIACQHCDRQFDVEMHSDSFAPIKHPQKLHYGDPPSHGCVGDTMNCEDIAVLQVWYRKKLDWKREKKFEGPII